LVAQGTVDDVDEVGGEAGEGGADGELFGGASEGGGVGNVGAADTTALPTWVSAGWVLVSGAEFGGNQQVFEVGGAFECNQRGEREDSTSE
jgi:hypothetical protein